MEGELEDGKRLFLVWWTLCSYLLIFVLGGFWDKTRGWGSIRHTLRLIKGGWVEGGLVRGRRIFLQAL